MSPTRRKKPKPPRWPRDSWHGRSLRFLRIINKVELGILIGGMILTLAKQAWWGLPLALGAWGLLRFVLYMTTIMSCPHCDEMLWPLSRHVEEILYCPYCGMPIDPDVPIRRKVRRSR